MKKDLPRAFGRDKGEETRVEQQSGRNDDAHFLYLIIFNVVSLYDLGNINYFPFLDCMIMIDTICSYYIYYILSINQICILQ